MYDGKKPAGLMFCVCSAAVFLPWLHLHPSHSSTDITDQAVFIKIMYIYKPKETFKLFFKIYVPIQHQLLWKALLQINV